MKVVEETQGVDPIGAVFVIILAGILSLLLTGCGYALVKIPEPGQRVSIAAEQRIQSAFETGIETVADEAPTLARFRRR